jgi:hypothetical protein
MVDELAMDAGRKITTEESLQVKGTSREIREQVTLI